MNRTSCVMNIKSKMKTLTGSEKKVANYILNNYMYILDYTVTELAEKAGISLAPTLRGEKQKKSHPYVVSEWHSEYEYVVTPGRMVRGPRYKYTHYLEGNGEELYDMKKDPGERKNLAKDPKYSKVLAEHRAMLDDYITRTKDDYRSLKVDADPRCRNHTPGYPNHEGPGVREILKRK